MVSVAVEAVAMLSPQARSQVLSWAFSPRFLHGNENTQDVCGQVLYTNVPGNFIVIALNGNSPEMETNPDDHL